MSIRELRKSLGFSQSAFAKYFGIPVTNIQHWEQGVSKPPEYVVCLIARVLDLERQLEMRR